MKTISVNGHDLHIYNRGEGSPILFVHGFPLNHSMWQDQLDEFADTYRVIAPDLRGFGNSGVTDGIVSMEQFADDLNLLLDALDINEPVTYCGLSMGGYIGWQFVRKYRERLKALILCNTKATADTPEGIANRKDMARKVLLFGPKPAVKTMLPALVSEKTNAERPHVLDRLREMILNTNRRSIAATLLGMSERPDSTALLEEVDVPTLAVAGAEDSLIPSKEMRLMAGAIANAEFVEIPDAGHLSPMEEPQAVNTVIMRFLETAG